MSRGAAVTHVVNKQRAVHAARYVKLLSLLNAALSATRVSSFIPTEHQVMPDSAAKTPPLSTSQNAPEGKIAVCKASRFC